MGNVDHERVAECHAPMPIFEKQLIYTTSPSSALAEPQPDLVDSAAASGLMARHFGFGQWKVTFPGEVQFSPQACEVFGIEPTDETLPLEFLVQRFHPDDRGKLLKLFAATLQETRAFHSVLRVIGADDEERVVESIGDLRIQDGRVTEMFGLSRDVTREARKEALSISRNRMLQDMVSSMPAPLAILDDKLTIVDCSAFWLRCHKMVDRADAVGKKLYDLFPSMPPALREENDRALAGEVIRTRRNFVNPTTGGKMECHAVITRWMTSEDKVGGLVILIGWHELGVAAAAQKAVEAPSFDGSLLDLLKEVS